MELNSQDLWSGQSLSVETLLSLRNVRQDQALQLLSSLESKGRGKGSVSVQNPNNYVQAAVVKIENRAAAPAPATAPVIVPPPSWNYADKKTRNRAAELGLDLVESALKGLARQPMKEAMSILEAAAWVASNSQDPNEFVHSELRQAEGEASASKAAPPRTAVAPPPRPKEEYAERPPLPRHSAHGQAHRQHQGYDDGPGRRRPGGGGGRHLEPPPKRARR